MNLWPQRIPPDLHDRITRATGLRGCHPNDVWAEVLAQAQMGLTSDPVSNAMVMMFRRDNIMTSNTKADGSIPYT